MSQVPQAREFLEQADAALSDDPSVAVERLSNAADILDAIDLTESYDASLVGRSVASYVDLARETDTDEGRTQAVQAGIDRAKQKLDLLT